MTLGKFKKFSALMALPLVAVACSLVVACDDDDAKLGSFAKTSAAVTAPVVVPSTPITAGSYAGTNINLPVAVANALPTGASLTVAPSGLNFDTTSPTTFDVSAGSAVDVSLVPAGTVLAAPGATLTIPYSPAALVAQGFAANEAALTQAIVEGAVFVTKVSGIGASATTEVLTPVPGSATLVAPFTVQIAGLTSFSRFQNIIDKAPGHTYDADTATTGFQLPAGQLWAQYVGAQLTAEGGVGSARKAILPTAANPQYTFTLKAGSSLGAGLVLSPSGAISGTPESVQGQDPLVAETRTFTVIVADAAGRTAERQFTLNLAAASIGVVTTNNLASGTVGEAYSSQLAVAGPGGTTVTNYVWTVDTGLDGSGLSLSATGVIEGTPSTITGASATYSFTVTATDSITNVTGSPKPLSIIVYNPLVINTATLPGGLVGTAYSASIDATGGKAPLTFAITQGTTPAGITMSSAGVFSGTANTDDPQTFTVTVTDSDNVAPNTARSVNMELSIIFNAKPVVTALTIGTSGVVDFEFSFTDADGSQSTMGYTAAFSYSVAGGASTAVKASALDANGNTLNNLAAGTTYTVKIDTSFTAAGLRLGSSAAADVTFSVTVTDNEFNNNGTGSDAETINNTQVTDPAASQIIAARVVATAGNNVTVEIRIKAGTGHSPGGANYDIEYDSALLTFVSYADGPKATDAGKSGAPGSDAALTGTMRRFRSVLVGFNANVIQDGVIGIVTFTAAAGAAGSTANLAVTNVVVTSPQATSITPRSGVAGAVVID